MKINDFSKIKKVAQILQIVLSIVFWIFFAVGSILLFAEIIILAMPSDTFVLNDFFNGNVVIGIKEWFEYDITDQVKDSFSLKPILIVMLPAFITNIIFYLINIKQLEHILKSVSKDRPFSEENAKRLFVMSVTFGVGSFLLQYLGSLVFIPIFEVFGLTGIGPDFTPNFTMLFTAIMLLILSGVFKYGNYLQKEYDYTV